MEEKDRLNGRLDREIPVNWFTCPEDPLILFNQVIAACV
jgi:hypothetical protein